jgi:putative restriction endonuclease
MRWSPLIQIIARAVVGPNAHLNGTAVCRAAAIEATRISCPHPNPSRSASRSRSLHHKIFDLGAFTVLPENHQIVFSRHLMGGDDTKAKLLAHHGAGLIEPQGRECLPHAEFLAWHRAEGFKEPARE